MKPLGGGVIPFFADTWTGTLSWSRLLSVFRLLCFVFFLLHSVMSLHYSTAGDEGRVKSNRRALPPHFQTTRLMF